MYLRNISSWPPWALGAEVAVPSPPPPAPLRAVASGNRGSFPGLPHQSKALLSLRAERGGTMRTFLKGTQIHTVFQSFLHSITITDEHRRLFLDMAMG